MDERLTMRGCLRWLESRNFQPEVGKHAPTFLVKVVVVAGLRREEVSRDREPFAIDEIRRRCVDVGLQRCSDRQERHWEFIEPLISFFAAESHERLFESAM